MSRPAILPHSVVAVAVALTAVLVAFASGYGYHRDELYLLAAGKRLAWGYPDQGPLTPAVALVADALGPGSLLALRFPSALAAAGTVLLAGLLARELGGGPRAQLIAVGCSAVASLVLTTGHLLSTATFDLLAWTAVTWLTVRAVRTGDDRLWPLVGLVVGLALLNKPLIAFLAVALGLGVAIAGPRTLFRNQWVWAGVAIAIVLWSPWLAWQGSHGWPQLEVSRAIAAGGSASSQPRWVLLPFQLLLVSPLLAPVWIVGLARLLLDPALRPFRFLAWAWVALAALFLAVGGKPYYLGGLLPALLAAGSVPADRWLDRGRRRVRRAIVVAAVGLSALVSATIALPILPADRTDPVVAVNPDAGETVGWRELVEQVASVTDELPAADRPIILTSNYGEAGAIDRYRSELGLPPAYSGHNGYWEWGPPPESLGPVVLVGYRNPRVLAAFWDCQLAAKIENRAGVDNDENGAPIWACAGVREPWPWLWPRLRRLG